MPRPCLLFHGFTGGPFEVEPLADYLAARGQHCEVPNLPWNGTDLAGLKASKWQDWVESAEMHAQRMTKQHGSFDLVGFSMGGLLAAYLAVRYPVRRLVLLNTAVIYVSPSRLLEVIREGWRQQDQDYLKKARTTPLRATWQFTCLVRQLKPELAKVAVPTFIGQGERDQVIHPLSAKYIYSKVSGERELYWYPKSKHLICHSEDAPDLFRQIEVFLEKE
ncbi:alpha/beta hydrolase [Paenibacillus hexagrammi]|uniref:Alpha/beta fold hydrolase n=1 Tax=Paenibacillus hexagrammi TaxID=2908839 RepID=A0ABY3SRH1_9BACL|nr:alpha/beta fold hydrolase [Paenibacillus sp. YPD9-1]UJF36015.1 alpha/beta fold hydrolase [Paenibacillus sp. YPD9-1]